MKNVPVLPLSSFQELLKSRIVWLNGEVTDDNMAEIASNVLLLSAKDPRSDITLIINSPGGSVTAGLMLYDTLQLVPNNIRTLGLGMCASMGQFLLTVGSPGKRFITPNTRVLLHQPSGGFGGVSTDIATQAQLIVDMKHQLAAITAERTGQSVDAVNRDGDRDKWFTATEALRYGFVDHIITHLSEMDTILDQNLEGK